MDAAARYYHRTGVEYFKNRGLSDRIIEEFCLGYSDGTLPEYLKIRPEEFVEAGLKKRKGDTRDIFSYRATIPIRNESGQIVAMGGRVTGHWEPKYLNSATNEWYQKSKILFGCDSAEYTDDMIVCEGYMDVLSCRDHGVNNSVAVLGTALTDDHVLFLLRKGVKRLILLFDTDGPGRNAVERSLDIIGDRMNVVIPSLLPYKDPDEFLQKESSSAFRKQIGKGLDRRHFLARHSASGLLDTLLNL